MNPASFTFHHSQFMWVPFSKRYLLIQHHRSDFLPSSKFAIISSVQVINSEVRSTRVQNPVLFPKWYWYGVFRHGFWNSLLRWAGDARCCLRGWWTCYDPDASTCWHLYLSQETHREEKEPKCHEMRWDDSRKINKKGQGVYGSSHVPGLTT